jgi:hypothetical protein
MSAYKCDVPIQLRSVFHYQEYARQLEKLINWLEYRDKQLKLGNVLKFRPKLIVPESVVDKSINRSKRELIAMAQERMAMQEKR